MISKMFTAFLVYDDYLILNDMMIKVVQQMVFKNPNYFVWRGNQDGETIRVT